MLRSNQPRILVRVNVWDLRGLDLVMAEPTRPEMVVSIARGYDAGDDSPVQWLSDERIAVPSDVVVHHWMRIPDGTKPIYIEVRDSVYAWLKSAGYIPEDAVEIA